MDLRRRQKKRKTHRKRKHTRKTRRLQHVSKPPNALVDFSPVSSPGPNSPPFSLSPNSEPNTPITKKAKLLAELYPTRQSMLKRSTSFSSNNNKGLTENEFYRRFEELFPEGNGPRYH